MPHVDSRSAATARLISTACGCCQANQRWPLFQLDAPPSPSPTRAALPLGDQSHLLQILLLLLLASLLASRVHHCAVTTANHLSLTLSTTFVQTNMVKVRASE
jgi:hypothetical protein